MSWQSLSRGKTKVMLRKFLQRICSGHPEVVRGSLSAHEMCMCSTYNSRSDRVASQDSVQSSDCLQHLSLLTSRPAQSHTISTSLGRTEPHCCSCASLYELLKLPFYFHFHFHFTLLSLKRICILQLMITFKDFTTHDHI